MTQIDRAENPKVSIEKSTYSSLDIASLLKPLGGMKRYVSNGDRVLLKVNLLGAKVPETAVITHPAVVRAVVEEVQKAGGEPIIGDSPSGRFSKGRLKKVYQLAGLVELSSELGVELNYDTRTKKVPIPNARKHKKTAICKFILEADKIIALPKIKTHSLMYMTLATKIMYGAVPGLSKAKYHSMYVKRESFADMLLDVLSLVPPHLFIMDGVLGMEGDGPFSGDPVELGVMMASVDAVALDLAVCEMLDIEPIGIPTLKRAKIRRLWPTRIEYPRLTPGDVHHKDFKLPSTSGYILTGKKIPPRRPFPTEKCIACGTCVEICPQNAIEIIDDRATVDYNKCIKCYCCHETCPEGAIKIVSEK